MPLSCTTPSPPNTAQKVLRFPQNREERRRSRTSPRHGGQQNLPRAQGEEWTAPASAGNAYRLAKKSPCSRRSPAAADHARDGQESEGGDARHPCSHRAPARTEPSGPQTSLRPEPHKACRSRRGARSPSTGFLHEREVSWKCRDGNRSRCGRGLREATRAALWNESSTGDGTRPTPWEHFTNVLRWGSVVKTSRKRPNRPPLGRERREHPGPLGSELRCVRRSVSSPRTGAGPQLGVQPRAEADVVGDHGSASESVLRPTAHSTRLP